MGQTQSKEELLYQQVREGNVKAIKTLCNEGARLECIDEAGRTPLIVASMYPMLYTVAETLIELGANVNAYRPGFHGGTPLHHAARNGLDCTVKLLLLHGANPFAINDDYQSPLAVARTVGHCNVVRVIEDHICYFSDDIHTIWVPGIFESLVPQRFARKCSKKSWVVVLPYDPPNNRKPPNLVLAVYSSPQDPQPHTFIPLWNSNILEPNSHESDPSLTIIDESNTRHKFLSAIEGDTQQLEKLYNACKGFPQVMPPSELSSTGISPSEPESNTSNQPESSSGSSSATNGWGDDVDGNHSAHSEWGPSNVPPHSNPSCNGWADNSTTEDYDGWADPGPSKPTVSPSTVVPTPVPSAPSAPPLPMDGFDDGPIHYPAIDVGPVDLSGPSGEANGKTNESCCVICWDGPVEGACIPCGHMAGCMSCLSEIKSKKGVCPVCRAKIDQVIRLYAV